MRLFFSVLLSVSALQLSTAQLSLFIPGLDDQPLSASEIGTDNQGHTTWQVVASASAGDIDSDDFDGTFTLVEGTDVASYSVVDAADDATVIADCGINGNNAVCTVTQIDSPDFDITTTMPVTLLAVQGSASATASGSSSNAKVTASSAKPGSSTGGSASQTGSGSAPSGSSKSSAKSLTLLGSQLLAIGLPVAAVLVA